MCSLNIIEINVAEPMWVPNEKFTLKMSIFELGVRITMKHFCAKFEEHIFTH